MANKFYTKEEHEEKIDLFAYAMVNVCMMNKSASYSYVLDKMEVPKEERPKYINVAGNDFYRKNKEKVEPRIKYYQEENRKIRNDIRDMNISVLMDIIATSKNNGDRLKAVNALNGMFGYDSKTVNIKADDTIVVELVE